MEFVRHDVDESVEHFHQRTLASDRRGLWVPRLTPARTLVLGSAQAAATIDTAGLHEAGIDVARRRSGGGAVLVSVADLVWFDVVLPAGDPLWSDDVGRAFEWLGESIAAALDRFGHDVEMHTGALVRSPWSDAICFAGLGPGELTIDGRKVVGISQRRSRSHARFQVAILRRWSGAEHASFLAGPDRASAAATDALESAAIGLDAEPEAILRAVAAELPD